jgi:ABC-type molybdate transport system ATPase subunit
MLDLYTGGGIIILKTVKWLDSTTKKESLHFINKFAKKNKISFVAVSFLNSK